MTHLQKTQLGPILLNSPRFWGGAVADSDNYAQVFQTLPCRASAVLRLELCLSQSVVDLDLICDLVRSDIGLAVTVLGASRRSHTSPVSIRNCAVQLGSERLQQLVRRISLISFKDFAGAKSTIEDVWWHSLLTAQAAELLAVYLDCQDPEESYLGGLLHEIGMLYALLHGASHRTPEQLLPLLAKAWGLPTFIPEALQSLTCGMLLSDASTPLCIAHQWSLLAKDAGPEFKRSAKSRWEAFIAQTLPFLSPERLDSLLHNLYLLALRRGVPPNG
jgi:HD-like signal output (HDOD) protein